MKTHPIKPKTNQSKPKAKRQMEILMTFLNENWNERNEKYTYTSIFGLFFYNQKIPNKWNKNNF